MKKFKKVSWCWKTGDNHRSVDSQGLDIFNAFEKLPQSRQEVALNNFKWIEIDGFRI